MKKRFKLKNKKSRRTFNKGLKTKRSNLRVRSMRGGTRL